MAIEDGWEMLEKYLDKKVNFEIKLLELFILTISAGIVILSLSEFKLIIISVLLQIISLIWILFIMIHDIRKKKDEKIMKDFKKIPFVITIPFGWNELVPILIYIVSIIIMGVIVLIPYI